MKSSALLPIPLMRYLTAFVGGETLYHEKVLNEGGSPIHHSGARSQTRSIEYSVDAETRMVIVKFRGKLTVGDIERYSKLLQANPTFRPGTAVLT